MQSSLSTILSNDVQKILNSFSSCFNIRIAFFSAHGGELKVGLSRPCSNFCRILRGPGDMLPLCLKNDEQHRRIAARRKKIITYKCHAGLVESIKPVFLDQQLIGYFMIGQIRTSGKFSEYKKITAKKIKKSELHRAFLQLPFYPQKNIKEIISIFSWLVEFIIIKNFISLRRHAAIDSILAHLRSSRGKLSLTEAAELTDRSKSGISHFFSAYFKKSYTRIQNEIQIEKALQLLHTGPLPRVKELANASGFSDQFYFSRVFKKITGVCPRIYILKHLALNRTGYTAKQ
ncbi:MAG TPA: hypothetical protein DC049_17535 [Spirochaetia bacterium]|nr:hypothetical protein [Spirochaetia bacterium]